MNKELSTWKWWESKRLNYNIALVISGIVAFIFYAIIVWNFEKYFNQAEVTIFSTIFQGILYLFMMLVANICYFLGHLSEVIIEPQNLAKFRNIIYRLGLIFSVSLPFFVPITMILIVIIKQ